VYKIEGGDYMYLEQANSFALYLVVGVILFFILCMCTVFMIKSYQAGIAIGMDKKLLKRSITSSITFTAVPSISILLGGSCTKWIFGDTFVMV